MDYKLILKLKDAGFPIEDNRGLIGEPTLSELIKECDKLDGFGQLGRAAGGWNVWQLGIREPKVFGETPEEAVAKLWLELNKK